MSAKNRTYILIQTRTQKLKVCLGVCELLLPLGIKALSKFKRINPVQFPLKLLEPRSFQIISEEKQLINALKCSKETVMQII